MRSEVMGDVNGPILIHGQEVGHALEGIEVLDNRLLNFKALILVLRDLVNVLDDRNRITVEIWGIAA
jgi:hypothetical protein